MSPRILARLLAKYLKLEGWGSPSTEQIPQPLPEVVDQALPENRKFLQADAMAHLRASQPIESAGSVESGDEVAQPKDLEIMTQVLGSRSRHHKGYGSMPRFKAVGGSRATSSRGTYQDHEKDKVIATLKEQVASQAEQLASQAQQLAAHTDVLAQLQKFIPGFQYQPQMGPSSAASNNPSND
ncbi:hypothetical protein LguiA_014696 [Lonicera macranthoides]